MEMRRIFTLVAILGAIEGSAAGQPAAATDSGSVIRAETRLVLVDAVVTDKKGGYIRDLTAKDFRVWEDNKEQSIKNFSFEADPASPMSRQPRYVVLFFDNSTMDFADQAQARKAAGQFIDASAAANRLMAIINYGGTIQIAQNFTSDPARLKAAAMGLSLPAVNINEPATMAVPGLDRAASTFAAYDVILALRTMARNLAAIPGRKTLILLTSGFPLKDPDLLSEVTATIDACNRANVAIYPIDVRGLVGGAPSGALFRSPAGMALGLTPFLREASLAVSSMAFFQRGGSPGGGAPGGGAPGGGGGAGGGARGGGGAPIGGGGPRGGVGGGMPGGSPSRGGPGLGTMPGRVGNVGPGINGPLVNQNAPYNQARNLIPKFPSSAATNQDVMHMLADGTGGFVIINTNDLLSGFQKIANELNEYYLLGYTPPESEEGSCHTLRVKVDRGGVTVRARTGYCNARSHDQLAKSPIEKTLESRAAGDQAGDITGSMQLPYFYTGPNQARVNVAMEIAAEAMKFEKEKGKLRSEMNILGIAYKPDGAVGARFSDNVKLEFETKKEVEAFEQHPYHYENQFDIAPGQYRLKVVFSAGGQSFGKLERPLMIEPYDGQKFAISGIAFSTKYRPAASMGTDLDALLIEDRTPLVAEGIQLFPTGSPRFKKTDKPAVYFEVYDPLLAQAELPKPFAIALQVRILDAKNGQQKVDTGMYRIPTPEKGGHPAIASGSQVPVAELEPGTYRIIVTALDTAGKQAQRWADFDVE